MAAARASLRLNLILAAVSTLIAIAFGEVVVRWARPQTLQSAYVWKDGTLRHLPSFNQRYTRAGMFSNLVHYNALGLRGPEVAAKAEGGRTRLLMLGDSFVEGKQVAEDEVMTAAMSALARRYGLDLEVINAGVAGYGTAEELLLWERLGRSLTPDLVLVAFYPNDVGNNVERGLYRLDDTGALRPAREPKRPKVRWAYSARHWLAGHSHLYVLAKDGLHEATRGGARANDGLSDAFLEASEAFAALPLDGEIPPGWRLTLALLDAMRRSVEASGARFAVVVLPARFQVYDEVWRKHAESLKLDRSAYDLEAPQKIFAAWSARTGGRVLDLLEPFRERAATGPPLYYLLDTHFTPAGHRLAAESILSALSAGPVTH